MSSRQSKQNINVINMPTGENIINESGYWMKEPDMHKPAFSTSTHSQDPDSNLYFFPGIFSLPKYREQNLKAKQIFELASSREMPLSPCQVFLVVLQPARRLLVDRDTVHSFPITLCASNQ